MSLSFIDEMQMSLHKLLSETPEIRLVVDRIYITTQQDAKYPFLLINIVQINNISKIRQKIYEVDFEISIFTREKNSKILTILVDNITEIIIKTPAQLKNHIIIGINYNNIIFQKAHDLITTKVTINFKILIKHMNEII